MKIHGSNLLFGPMLACAMIIAVTLSPVVGYPQEEAVAQPHGPYSSSELQDRDIKVLTAAGATSVTPDNIESFPPTAIFAERTAQTTRDLQTGDVMLPFNYRTRLPSGEEFSFRAKLVVLKPVAYDNASDTFKGRLGLGVLSETHPAASGSIGQSVSFSLAGDADSIIPTQLEIDHLNLPFTNIEVEVKEPDDEVSLQVFASFAPDEPEEIRLASSRPKLGISIAPTSIDGFGLAVADVRVEAHRSYAGRTVSLGYEKGRVEQSVLTLDDNGNAQTQLRSQFIGETEVTASGYPFVGASASIGFGWPVALFVMGILGALGGAFVRKFAKSAPEEKLGVAVFCGFLGAVLAALGVNFLNLPVTLPAGEAFTFVVAALSGYAGPAIFSMVTPN